MKKILLICYLCCIWYHVFAQAGAINEVQQPLSPNAAEFGKFVEIPVGDFTGVPDISIPLYEVKAKDFSLPISLAYHASGIKVVEIPGWVGAGFLLQAGGAIIRVVRGLPDGMDSPGGNDLNNLGYKGLIGSYGQPGYYWPDGRMDKDVVSEYYSQKIDMQFDEFYYNFMGYTGSFMFNNQGKIMTKVVSNLKVEYSIDNFKITDGKGIIYEFKSYESQSYNPHWYISSWYLTKAINPFKNEVIEFKYEPFGLISPYRTSYGAPSYFDQVLSYDKSPHSPPGIKNPGCEQEGSEGVIPNELNSENLFLKQIIYKTDTIRFYPDKTKRTDIYKIRLDSMTVSSGNKLVHKASFSYTYSDTLTADSLDKKMLLKSIKIDDQQPYYFDYYGNYQAHSMPGILREGADFWGFYNGENSPYSPVGHRIFPKYSLKHVPTYNNDRNSSYRNPDWRYGQIGSLKRITYPTGGNTEFEYEGNEFAGTIYGRPMILDSIRTAGILSNYVTSTSGPQILNNEFTIHYDQTVTINTSIKISDDIVDLNSYRTRLYNISPQNRIGQVRLFKFNTITGIFDLVESRSFNPVTAIGNPATDADFYNARPNGISEESHTRFLTAGRYKVQTELRSPITASITLDNQFKYSKSGTVYNMGGIRIKKVKFNSPVTSSSFEKTYDYSYNGITSGKLLMPYLCISTWVYWGEYRTTWNVNGNPVFNVTAQLCMYNKIHHNSVIPLGNGKSGPIGYEHVTEKMSDGRRKVMEFSTVGDSYSIEAITTDNFPLRGNLKSIDYYDGNNKKLKREVHTLNSSLTSLNVHNAFLDKTSIVASLLPVIPPSSRWAELVIPQSKVVPGIDSVFYFNGLDTLKEVTKYSYNNESYTNPSKITRINSSGDSTVTNFKYGYDYTISGSTGVPLSQGVKLLQDKNVTDRPIENYVQKYTAGVPKVIEAQLVAFKPTVPLPDTVYTLTNTAGLADFTPAIFTVSTASKDSRYNRRLLFNKYDNGDVVEQCKDGDAKEVLVWGYKKRFIVARIQGVDYKTVIALVDTNVVNDPSSDAAMRTELQKIRAGLAISSPIAKVTTYTFAPLMGMTSSTDPRGEVTYYEYDTYGKLKRTKDLNGDIKANIWYHYKP